MRSCFVVVLLVLASSGCSDSNDSSASALGSCGAAAQLSGAVMASFLGNDDAACVTSHSFDKGVNAGFLHIDSKVTLQLDIPEVEEGKTGTYAASVRFSNQANQAFSSDDCQVDLSEHALLSTEASELGELRHYQLTGHGWCDSALEPVGTGASGNVEISEFDFRVQLTWRD
jgi:hypothetical protein